MAERARCCTDDAASSPLVCAAAVPSKESEISHVDELLDYLVAAGAPDRATAARLWVAVRRSEFLVLEAAIWADRLANEEIER